MATLESTALAKRMVSQMAWKLETFQSVDDGTRRLWAVAVMVSLLWIPGCSRSDTSRPLDPDFVSECPEMMCVAHGWPKYQPSGFFVDVQPRVIGQSPSGVFAANGSWLIWGVGFGRLQSQDAVGQSMPIVGSQIRFLDRDADALGLWSERGTIVAPCVAGQTIYYSLAHREGPRRIEEGVVMVDSNPLTMQSYGNVTLRAWTRGANESLPLAIHAGQAVVEACDQETILIRTAPASRMFAESNGSGEQRWLYRIGGALSDADLPLLQGPWPTVRNGSAGVFQHAGILYYEVHEESGNGLQSRIIARNLTSRVEHVLWQGKQPVIKFLARDQMVVRWDGTELNIELNGSHVLRRNVNYLHDFVAPTQWPLVIWIEQGPQIAFEGQRMLAAHVETGEVKVLADAQARARIALYPYLAASDNLLFVGDHYLGNDGHRGYDTISEIDLADVLAMFE
jgi:hypothetical protein